MALTQQQIQEMDKLTGVNTTDESVSSAAQDVANWRRQAQIYDAQKQVTEQNIVTPPQSFAGEVAEGINKGYEKFTELPGIKQFKQAIGGLAGTGAAFIGGMVGALGETGVQAYKATKGKGFDVGEIQKSAKDIGAETGRFGQEVGKIGAPAALLGGAGRLVNLALAYGMGYSGYDELKQGVQEKDATKIYEGLQNLVIASIAGKHGVSKGEQGALINPKIKNQLKSEVNSILGKNPEMVLTEAKNTATEAYRSVLRPSASEIKKYEMVKGENLNDYYSKIAEDGVQIERNATDPTKLDTTEAYNVNEIKMNQKRAELIKELETKPTNLVNLREAYKKTAEAINEMTLSKAEKAERIVELKELYQTELTTNELNAGNPLLNGIDANTIKESMWRKGYKNDRPTQQATARQFGHFISDTIKDVYKDTNVASILDELKTRNGVERLLLSANGRVIQGGMLPRQLAGISGAIVGSTLNVPILGPMLGRVGGQTIYDFIQSPERITGKALRGVKESKQMPKPILQKK